MKLDDVQDSVKSEVDEMSQLWAAEGSGASHDPEDKKDGSTEGAESFGDEKPEGEEAKPSVDAKDQEAEKPAKEAAAEPAKPEAAAKDQPDFEPPSWAAFLPADVRDQAIADLKNSRSNVKAQSNRVSQLTKHLNEARQQLQAAQSASKQMPKFELRPDAKLDEVEKEWPEVAQYIRTMAAQMNQQISAHNAQVANTLQAAQESQLRIAEADLVNEIEAVKETERQRVRQHVPDVEKIVADPTFARWLGAQAPGVQALIHSASADDNITLFNLYKGSRPAPAQKRLADHVELPRKGGAPAAAVVDDNADPTDYWKQLIAAEKQKAR